MIAFLPPRSFIVVLLLTHVPALGGALDDDRVVEGTSTRIPKKSHPSL